MSSNNPNFYHSGETVPVMMWANNVGFNFFIGDLLVFESTSHSTAASVADNITHSTTANVDQQAVHDSFCGVAAEAVINSQSGGPASPQIRVHTRGRHRFTASGTITRGDLVGAVYNSSTAKLENQNVQTVTNEKYAIGVAVSDAVSGGTVVVEIISTQFWGGPQPKAS
ncbi:MAG TPA: hypothetical protein VFE46_11345 [Pirellulales bacterium]|nr:hypothetical protein [Pirellulales bacterium]